MLPIYLGSLTLGGILIGASILFGDGDIDADADFDVDVDFDADFEGGLDVDNDLMLVVKDPADAVVDAGTWLPFLSLRFWTFAMAAFGLSGSLLTLLGVAKVITAVVSAIMATGIGTGASWMFRALQTTQVSGNVGLRDVRGNEAKVLLPVGPNKLGKVRLMLDGQYVDLPARTQCKELISRGNKVLVVDVSDGVADITSVPIGYQSMRKEH
jgi:membrane protein implicated in regulation of membrane protease activity